MIPPAPTRMLDVAAATWAMAIDVAALAMPGMLWCSASQKRRYPQRSACRARSTELRSAWAASLPSTIGARSRTDSDVTRATIADDLVGNPGRVPNPSRDELRRAKLASAHAIDVGTLGGFPTPPATSSGEQSSPPLTRSTWEPWEGSQPLPRRAPASKA